MEQNDLFNSDFTKTDLLLYSVIYPLGLLCACALAELLNRL